MGLSRDNWHKQRKTKGKRKTRGEKMSWETLLLALRLATVLPHAHSLCVGRQQEIPFLKAGPGQPLLGLPVLCVHNEDYWCLRCTQEQTGPHQALSEELHRAHWEHPVPTELQVPLCTAPGLQEGGQADSWEGSNFKQKTMKGNSEEIKWKEKECHNQQSSRGKVPANKLHVCIAPRPGQCGRAGDHVLEGKEPES